MLSGFVIFYLLDHQRVSYREFITKRFFRLAPLYFTVLAVAAWSMDWQLSVIQDYPWQNATTKHDLVLHMDAIRNLAVQFVAHLSLLHGLIPDAILPGSQYAIVGQAWSISVEWQFYLVAPFLFSLVVRGEWRTLACVLLLLCGVYTRNYVGEGFAVNQTVFFLIGILSYYLWRRVHAAADLRPPMIEAGCVIAMVLAYLTIKDALALIIWSAMMGVACVETGKWRSGLFAHIGQVLCSGPLQFLGRISYSVYMTHMLVLYLWSAVWSRALPGMDKPQFLVLNVLAVAMTTILVSAVSYRLIELPGVRLGSQLAARMSGKTQKKPEAVGA
jgi:peptidoglycan/LPS O-acetylase OafA/YrhL